MALCCICSSASTKLSVIMNLFKFYVKHFSLNHSNHIISLKFLRSNPSLYSFISGVRSRCGWWVCVIAWYRGLDSLASKFLAVTLIFKPRIDVFWSCWIFDHAMLHALILVICFHNQVVTLIEHAYANFQQLEASVYNPLNIRLSWLINNSVEWNFVSKLGWLKLWLKNEAYIWFYEV